MITLLRFLSIIMLAALSMASQGAQTLDERAQSIITKMGNPLAVGNPKSIYRLSEDDRQTLLAYYRAALDKLAAPGVPASKAKMEAPQYKEELIMLGDSDALAAAVKIIVADDVSSPLFQDTFHDLLHSARPELVAMLAPGALTDEPFVIGPMRGDVGSLIPKSYGLAVGLLQIMANSLAFSDEVRRWADDNSQVRAEKVLPMFRQWWSENQQYLQAREYDKVQPGKDLHVAERDAAEAIDARAQAYRNDLIAKGKSPADLANWEEWRKVIYPSLATATPKAIPTAVAPAEPQSPANGSAVEHNGSVWWWMIGAVVSVLLAMLIWRRRT